MSHTRSTKSPIEIGNMNDHPHRLSNKLLLIAIAALLALFAASCGSNGASNDNGASTDTAESSETSETAENDGKEGEVSMAESSPLGAFFAGDGGFETAMDNFQTKIEEEIKTCMADQGFKYEIGATNQARSRVEDDAFNLSEADWAKEHGFGISTSFDDAFNMQTADPNSKLLAEMSPSEIQAWQEALLGDQGAAVMFGEDTTPNYEEMGCIGGALIKLGADKAFDGMEKFGSSYEEGLAALKEKPEMVKAAAEWSTCMADAGYIGFEDQDELEVDFQTRFQTVAAQLSIQMDALDEETARGFFEGTTSIDNVEGIDIKPLRDLQKEERETAVVAHGCYAEHVEAIYKPLRDEFEKGLISDFAEQLDVLKGLGG